MAEPEVLLKPREAATSLGISYATIKQWILAGTIKTIRTPGGHHRIPQSSLASLIHSSDKPQPVENQIQSRERFRQVSGRNQLIGKIVDVKISGLMAQVILGIGDQRITSIISADAAREMQLRKGQTAAALMKSTEVMIIRV
jgi:molybdopterin-binding protein